MIGNLKMAFSGFNAEDYATRLPAAYYSNELNMIPAENIWNFEINGLPEYENAVLDLRFIETVDSVEIRIKGHEFQKVAVCDHHAEISVSLNERILSFDIRLDAGTDCGTCPLSEISLSIPDADLPDYKRETALENCNLLSDWTGSYEKIMSEDFDLSEIAVMRDEIFEWIAGRQVLSKDDPHYGAVYSEEDKYCFRDAVFAAACFMKKYRRTGENAWFERAVAARDYSFKGQYLGTGNPAKDGAWAAMGIIDDPAGKNFRRITDKWAQASGVDSSIIGIVSGELYEMGMPFSDVQLEQLVQAVAWNIRNEIGYGWFSHHEGMTLNCINVNTLAASMLYSVHKVLMESRGIGLKKEILEEAGQSVRNVMQCQEAIGVFPYRKGDFKRGGKYSCENLPDNGMTLQALMYLLKNKYGKFSLSGLAGNLRKSALWYLLCSRWENGRLVLEYRTDEEFLKSVAFGNFTWCRMMMIDVISQEWDHIGNTLFWKQFIRCHLRTLRETFWNENDKTRAPLKSSVVPIRLVSWIQQAEWACWVLDNLIDRCKC